MAYLPLLIRALVYRVRYYLLLRVIYTLELIKWKGSYNLHLQVVSGFAGRQRTST